MSTAQFSFLIRIRSKEARMIGGPIAILIKILESLIVIAKAVQNARRSSKMMISM